MTTATVRGPSRAPFQEQPPEPAPRWGWWLGGAALLLLAGYLLFCHGCHGDEDNELLVGSWDRIPILLNPEKTGSESYPTASEAWHFHRPGLGEQGDPLGEALVIRAELKPRRQSLFDLLHAGIVRPVKAADRDDAAGPRVQDVGLETELVQDFGHVVGVMGDGA